MLLDNKPYTFDRVVRIALGFGVLYVLLWLLTELSEVLIPFAIAFLLAYLINPLVNRVQRRIRPRGLAVILTLAALLIAALAMLHIVIPIVAQEINSTGHLLTQLDNVQLSARVTQAIPSSWLDALRDELTEDKVQALFTPERRRAMAQAALRRVLPGLWRLFTGAAYAVLSLAVIGVIFLYLFFLLLDFGRIQDRWKGLIPAPYRSAAVDFLHEFNLAMSHYFRGQAMIAGSVGALFAVGFWLINLPMGIVLGLLIGVLNMVPYLQILGLIPAYLLAILAPLVTGGSIWVMVGEVTLVFAIVQATQDFILTPRIMGKQTGLSPVIILLSLSVWGKLLGFFGLLIAIPATCLFLVYYRRFLKTYADEKG